MIKGYKVNDNYILHKSGKNISFFDPDNSILLKLNHSGSIIFKYLNHGKDIAYIVQRFVKLYKIKEEQALTDIKNFIQYLFREKIIEKE